jgi:predicted RNA polymerase sigma factor
MRRKLTKLSEEALRRDWETGRYTYREVGQRHGVSVAIAWRIVNKGRPLKRRMRDEHGRFTFPAEDRQVVLGVRITVKKLFVEGVTVPELARAFGIEEEWIRKQLTPAVMQLRSQQKDLSKEIDRHEQILDPNNPEDAAQIEKDLQSNK